MWWQKKKSPPLGVHAKNSKNRGSHLDVEFLKNFKKKYNIKKKYKGSVRVGPPPNSEFAVAINKRFFGGVIFVDLRYSIFYDFFIRLYF